MCSKVRHFKQHRGRATDNATMKIDSSKKIRTQNDDGQIRRIRGDAQIGNVKSIQQSAPDLIEGMGPKTLVKELRAAFGGKDVSEIVALPKAQRAVAIEQRLQAMGLDNNAAKAVMTAALLGSLGDKIAGQDSYYITIGGKKMDRALLEGFVQSLMGAKDNVVSAKEAKSAIVPEMLDGKGMTAIETETYMFALQHFPITEKAVREALVPALREATGSPVQHIGDGQVGYEFTELYSHLQTHGRLQDLYAAKAEMSQADMLNMWDNKISLQDLNGFLEKATQPKTLKALKEQFGADEVQGVQTWLKSEGDTVTLKRLAGGKMSAGELQNLIYGSWQMENTPYDPHYKADYAPIPITKTKPSGAEKALAKFVDGLESQINAHDWKGLMKSFNAENRATQKELGVGDAQYIAEGLGLHMVDNSLPGDITKMSALNQIKSVTLHREGSLDGEIKGVATLKDGSELAVSIPVSAKGKGFEITPAVG